MLTLPETPYDDIIDCDRPHSARPPLSMASRAAQFSAFAALSGYEQLIDESSRVTEEKRELHASEIDRINAQLAALEQHLPERPTVRIHYFQADAHKPGGTYVTVRAAVKQIDSVQSCLRLADGRSIALDCLTGLDLDADGA